jgi:hypothetical protein
MSRPPFWNQAKCPPHPWCRLRRCLGPGTLLYFNGSFVANLHPQRLALLRGVRTRPASSIFKISDQVSSIVIDLCYDVYDPIRYGGRRTLTFEMPPSHSLIFFSSIAFLVTTWKARSGSAGAAEGSAAGRPSTRRMSSSASCAISGSGNRGARAFRYRPAGRNDPRSVVRRPLARLRRRTGQHLHIPFL